MFMFCVKRGRNEPSNWCVTMAETELGQEFSLICFEYEKQMLLRCFVVE